MKVKTPPKNAVVPKVKGKCDYWLPIDIVVEDTANADIFNYDSVDDIAESIKKDGLHECPQVWKNSQQLTSGHSRYRAFLKLGYTHLPVVELDEEIPTSEFERIKRLQVSNIYRDVRFSDRYRLVKKARDVYFKETNKLISDQLMVELCAEARIARGDYNIMEEMRQKYPTYYDKVMKDALGVREAYKAATMVKTKMRTSKDLSNLLNKTDVNYLVTSICQTITGLKNLDTGIISLGNTFNPLARVDQNFYSNAIHSTVCAYMAHKLNSFEDFANDWKQTDNQNTHHDVWSHEDDTGIEVKTSQCRMNETPRWTPKRFKEGYHLLIATCPPNDKGEIESIFIGFGKLKQEHVRPANQGKVEVIPEKLWELYESGEFTVWRGKISKDKDGKLNFKQQLIG